MLSGQLRERKFAWTAEGAAGEEVGTPGVMDAGKAEKSAGGLQRDVGSERCTAGRQVEIVGAI